jgi:N-acetylmuramoyl-L-alanine amidase
MSRMLGLLLVFTVYLGLVQPAAPATAEELPAVVGLRAAEHDGTTRFVLDLTGKVVFTISRAGDPAVVHLDLPDVDWRVDTSGPARRVGLLQHFAYTPGRVTLAGGGSLDVKKAFFIPPGKETSNYRLVIDLGAGGPAAKPPSASAGDTVVAPAAAPVARKPALSPAPAGFTPPAPAPGAVPRAEAAADSDAVVRAPQGDTIARGSVPARQVKPVDPPPPKAIPVALPMSPTPEPMGKSGGRKPGRSGKPVVVLDPGHGGNDPGATSLTGAYEKNIVLALARDVKAQLDKDGKVLCQLTRDRDVFIPLRERVAVARSANADLFISLHADTVTDSDIRGLSVYTLSRTASDAEAQALADKENKADIVGGIDLSNESPEVTNILIDLVQRETMNLSAVFANYVIKEVSQETHELLQNTHRFAGFAVLKAPDVPSVLIETGYLSNESDEQMLRRPDYRAKLAKALARAVEGYFAKTQKARRS